MGRNVDVPKTELQPKVWFFDNFTYLIQENFRDKI